MNTKQNQVADDIYNRLSSSAPGFYRYWSDTVDRSVAQALIKKGPFFSYGNSWRFKAESLGAGMYRVKIIEA
jgi:hypothetical protein